MILLNQFELNETTEFIIPVVIAIVTIILMVIFGVPTIKSFWLEKKKQRLSFTTLFKSSGWIKSSEIDYSSLDKIREMQNNQVLNYQQDSIKKIQEILNRRKLKEERNHILFIGPSLSGKTHTTITILAKLPSAYVLIPNESTFSIASKSDYELPVPPRNAQHKIVLLDNFHEFFKGNGITPKNLINKAIAKGYVIWANCISIDEYDRVMLSLDFKEGEYGFFQKIELKEKIKKIELRKVQKNLGLKLIPQTFNGFMGELIYPPSDMYTHYIHLRSHIITRDLLFFIKQAYMLGAFEIPYLMKIDLIRKAYEKKYEKNLISFMQGLKKIEQKGFIKLSTDHKTFLFESVWLNEIIEPDMKVKEFYSYWDDILPKNLVYYTNLMHSSGNYDDMISILQDVLKEGIVPDVRIYTTLISLSPDYDTALDWFNKIEDGKASFVTYTTLIKLSPNYEIALNWFNKIECGKASFITYNTLMSISPDYETALEWFDKIEDDKINSYTYNTLIKLSPDYETTLEWFDKIKDDKTNSYTYNKLINLSPDYETALKWFKKIDDDKIDSYTYNTLIKLSPDYETALEWFNKIKDYEVSNFTYNSLIIKTDDLKIALKLKQQMQNNNIEIDNYTYGSLFKVISKTKNSLKHKYQLAINLHDEMINNGICSNTILYTYLISFSPSFETAFTLLKLMITQKDGFDKIIKPNFITKKTILRKTYQKKELIEKVNVFFRNI